MTNYVSTSKNSQIKQTNNKLRYRHPNTAKQQTEPAETPNKKTKKIIVEIIILLCVLALAAIITNQINLTVTKKIFLIIDIIALFIISMIQYRNEKTPIRVLLFACTLASVIAAGIIFSPEISEKTEGIKTTGIAEEAETVIGTGALTMAIYPAEKIDWDTGGINELWEVGDNYKVYDVETGIIWWAHRSGGIGHIDAEPLTEEDTERLCKCYSVSSSEEISDQILFKRRPLLVTIGKKTYACSLYAMPHDTEEGDIMSNNEFNGQVCIHFTNSRTHSGHIDSSHQKTIELALENAPKGQK